MPSEKPCIAGDGHTENGDSDSTATLTWTPYPNVLFEGSPAAITSVAIATAGGTYPCGSATPSTGTGIIMAGSSGNVLLGGQKIMIDGDIGTSSEAGTNTSGNTVVACTSSNDVNVDSSITKVKIS